MEADEPPEEETRKMAREFVFEVWGGYEDQEQSEDFAEFDTLVEAENYVRETRMANPRLILNISKRDRFMTGEEA